jgi:hypothetical protein
MTNAEVISKLRGCKGQIARIAREAQVSEKNLRNLYAGRTSSTRPETLDAVRAWFLKQN